MDQYVWAPLLQVGTSPTPQQLERARAHERNNRARVKVISGDWLHACAQQRRLVPPEQYPFTARPTVRPARAL